MTMKMIDLIITDKPRAIKFRNVSCFIDDRCVKIVRIQSYSGTYFPTFGLNKDQNNSEYEHFLRSGWEQFKRFFKVFLCNLTQLIVIEREFIFIVRMLDLNGKILAYISYGLTWSELFRIAKCTLKFSDFVLKTEQLFLIMRNQG